MNDRPFPAASVEAPPPPGPALFRIPPAILRDGGWVLFEKNPHPAWLVDSITFRIRAANEAATHVYGYTRWEVTRMTYLDLHLPEDRTAVRDQIAQSGAHGNTGGVTWRHTTNLGVPLDVLVAWKAVSFCGRPALLLSTTLVSSRERAAQRKIVAHESPPSPPDPATLRSAYRPSPISIAIQTLAEQELSNVSDHRDRLAGLARRLVELQEAERQAVAQELHDEVGQLLTGLKLMLSSGRMIPAGPREGALKETTVLHEAELLVNELLTRIRDLSMSLRPPILDEFGLVPALEWHFHRYTARTGVSVQFNKTGSQRFSTPVETGAFRIVQEALTNVARHAGVKEAKVSVNAGRKALRIRIEDQGAGYDSKLVVAGRSAGLTGMRERALVLGGQMTIDSAPGEGTRLLVEIPLEAV